MATPCPPSVLRTLINASHILHNQQILDAYGHVSAIHPTNPNVYIMSRSVAPALVTSPSDLIAYSVVDSEPLWDGNGKLFHAGEVAPQGFQERFIHGEIYRRFPIVRAVVHSHAEDVLPFAVRDAAREDEGDAGRLRAVFHLAGFLGHGVPTFNIRTAYTLTDRQDLLVSAPHLGGALAACFTSPSRYGVEHLLHRVVLMAGHGFTAVGEGGLDVEEGIKQAVFRAIYTAVNARVQMKTLLMDASPGSRNGEHRGGIRGGERWSDDVVVATGIMGRQTQGRPWELWVREVEICPLYRNEA